MWLKYESILQYYSIFKTFVSVYAIMQYNSEIIEQK